MFKLFKKPAPYTAQEIQDWEDIQAERLKRGDKEGAVMAGKVISFYLEELEHWVSKQRRGK